MNRDVFNCLQEENTVIEAYKIINALQDMPMPEQRLCSVFLVAMVMAEEMGERLPDLLQTVDNLSRDSERRRTPNVGAMHLYIKNEVLT